MSVFNKNRIFIGAKPFFLLQGSTLYIKNLTWNTTTRSLDLSYFRLGNKKGRYLLLCTTVIDLPKGGTPRVGTLYYPPRYMPSTKPLTWAVPFTFHLKKQQYIIRRLSFPPCRRCSREYGSQVVSLLCHVYSLRPWNMHLPLGQRRETSSSSSS